MVLIHFAKTPMWLQFWEGLLGTVAHTLRHKFQELTNEPCTVLNQRLTALTRFIGTGQKKYL